MPAKARLDCVYEMIVIVIIPKINHLSERFQVMIYHTSESRK